MKRKLLLLCLVELVCSTIWGAVSTHLALDTRTGTRTISAAAENLRYDASWYKSGKTATITDNDEVLVSDTSGVQKWNPTRCGEHKLVLKINDASGKQIGSATANYVGHINTPVRVETVAPTRGYAGVTAGLKCSSCGQWFEGGEKIYVFNFSARELQPWNGLVEISYELAEDLEPGYELQFNLVDKVLNVTNVITQFVSDPPRSQGVHHILWKGREEFPNRKWERVAFVASTYLGGVQLWENGPYWADCNVGATKPEEYGYYFWWGDTKGYTHDGNQWNAVDGSRKGFEFSSSNCLTYGKSEAELQSVGYIDSSGNLDPKYDAATKHWGAPWRMPTSAEIDALINNCDIEWTTRKGVAGRLVKGRGAYASKSIFLPVAGYGYGSYLNDVGSDGTYWSSTPHSGNSSYAGCLSFSSSNFSRYSNYRRSGQSVRPLRDFAP